MRWMRWTGDCWMAGSSEFKWHATAGRLLHIEAAAAVVAGDHAAEAGIEDAPAPGRAAGPGAETGIAGGPTAAAVAARVPIVRARAGSLALAASLRTGKKTVVPNQGTEVIEPCEYDCEQLHVMRVQNNRFLRMKRYSITLYT